MKVCMFVLNNCKYDTRVLKEARTLADAGHDVRIIAVLDEDTEPYEKKDGFRIIRVTQRRVPRRVPQAIIKAESFLVGLIFRIPRWAYHLTKRRLARPSCQVGQQYQGEQSYQGKPWHAPARPKVEQLLGVTYSVVRRDVYRVRRRVYGAVRTILQVLYWPLALGEYCHRSWQAIKDEPADIYHSHDLTALPAGYMAKRRTGGKLLYDSHELFTQLHYIPRIERPAFGFLERHLIRRADAVVTVNEFAAAWLQERYEISLPAVVRNCPPAVTCGDGRPNSLLRKSLGLDDATPIIVHVGMFNRARGSEKLISAVPFLDRGVVVFLGWGAGTEGDDLRGLVTRKGLGNRVLFAPPVAPDQVVGYINSAQVGIIPFLNVSLNHYYATPNKVWECMTAGLPVVASNFPALKAIVEGYRLGCTCDPEYPRDIANAINYVLSDRCRYEEMKRNALKAARIFSWENESRKLVEAYRRLSNTPDDRTA